MNEQEALNLLDEVAARFSGTRKDHEHLAAAVSSLQKLIEHYKQSITPSIEMPYKSEP